MHTYFILPAIFGIFFEVLLIRTNAEVKITNKAESDNNETQLPECKYIDPATEMKRWDEYDFSKCQIINFKPPKSDINADERFYAGEKHYSYNSYVSDMIGARRDLTNFDTNQRYSIFCYFKLQYYATKNFESDVVFLLISYMSIF